MEKPLSGRYSKVSKLQVGLSLMELMVTLVIVSIVVGLISQNFANLSRVTNRFVESVVLKEQLTIFLLQFENDYHQSELDSSSDATNLDDLKFSFDLNRDGDYNDSGERIQYRWNASKKRIDRKSGNGNFQSLLEGITAFSWEKAEFNNYCHLMTIENPFRKTKDRISYCRSANHY